MEIIVNDNLKKICPRCGGEITSKGKCLQCKKKPLLISNDKRFLKPYTLLNNKYVLFNIVGTGGFGVTYSAYNIFTREHIAIKEFFPESFTHRKEDGSLELDSPDYKIKMFNGQKRFASEARKMLALKDIHFVSHVIDMFSENNTSYIVMEYAKGKTLKEYIDKSRFLTNKKIIKMLSSVFISIWSLHTKGLVHCDISPDNIVINDDNMASLIDFGAAKEINSSIVDISITVKNGYTPQELYKINAKPSIQSDIYSLGATLYYCFFKHPLPIATNETSMKLAFKDIDRKFKHNPKVAESLKKSLSFDNENRYSSVIDFLTEVAD